MQRDLLRFLCIPGIGPVKALDLLRFFDDIQGIFKAKFADLITVPGVSDELAKRILATPDDELLDAQGMLMDKYSVQLIAQWDEAYPQILREIYDPPIALFCRGKADLLHLPGIGLVGTRTPSKYGLEVTERLSTDLSRHDFSVVSGAARGIDTVAHRTAMMNGGSTVAVMGCGVDRAYPAENKGMLEEIAEKGLIISEFLMGAKPDAQNFPRRNRIISGLSKGVVIIEAAERSGSLITAFLALDQNREVFAIPGSRFSGQSIGTNRLIKQGAHLVCSIEDVMEELGERYRMGRSPGQTELLFALDDEERSVFMEIGEEARHIDDLSAALELPTYSLLGILLRLEMKGLINQLPGKYFTRKGMS